MSTMAAVLRLLLVACAALAALAQETRSLRIGVVAQNARPMFYGVPGSGWEGENGARGPRPASMGASPSPSALLLAPQALRWQCGPKCARPRLSLARWWS